MVGEVVSWDNENRKEMIQVKISNYNRKTKEHEFAKQEIVNLSILELKNLLREIPIKEKTQKYPVLIITDNLIFYRKDESFCEYGFNSNKARKGKSTIEIENIERVFERAEIEKPKNKMILILIGLLSYLMFGFVPIVNLIIISQMIILNISNMNIVIFLLWLLIISLISISSLSISFAQDNIKKRQLITLEYSRRFSKKAKDLSMAIILYGQSFYVVIFIILYQLGLAELPNINATIFLLYLCFSIGISIIFLIILPLMYFSNKREKASILQYIYQNMHLSDEKNYYLQLALEIEKEPLIPVGLIPKLIVILTLFSTFIPMIL